MTTEDTHKFDDTLVMTYAQYFRSMFSRSISMIRAFEAEFGKEKVEEVQNYIHLCINSLCFKFILFTPS
ncbi:MAG: hypothetical protein KGD60_09660 [Candidatus Thorarchaeota archaeon]|nr:hypothetical protein [Candidatus Thorarchaeota archaeon]